MLLLEVPSGALATWRKYAVLCTGVKGEHHPQTGAVGIPEVNFAFTWVNVFRICGIGRVSEVRVLIGVVAVYRRKREV